MEQIIKTFLRNCIITLISACRDLTCCVLMIGLVLFAAQIQPASDESDIQQHEMSSSSSAELVSIMLLDPVCLSKHFSSPNF